MAFNLITGVMGAGKTHEAVSLLSEHVKSKRRVVTNIAGLNVEKMSEYVGFDASPYLICVSVERVMEPGFFPTERLVEAHLMDVPTVVKPGDLVVLDEVWRYWPGGKAPDAEAMDYFRMHRHFANPDTGHTCDIVVLIQDVSSLNRLIKDLVETHFQCRKHRSLGLDNRYLIKQFGGATTRRALLENQFQRKYDKKIFGLYKSHTVAGAKEGVIDKKTVVWKNPMFILTVVFGLFAVTVLPIFAFSKFRHMAGGDAKAASGDQSKNTAGSNAPGPAGQAGAAGPATVAGTPAAPSIPLRVAGVVRGPDGNGWVIVDDGSGARLMPQGAFTGNGVGFYGDVDGKKASTWGGRVPATREPGGRKGSGGL
ncbi:zonular occludens toxin domain-containing protein [Sphingomonas oryzagri]